MTGQGTSFKLPEGRFRLDTRKKKTMMRVVRHWDRLPRDKVDFSLCDLQSQVGPGFEQPALVKDVPA